MTNNRVRIGFQNLMENATSVTPDNEDVTLPIENAFDWKVYDFYRMNSNGTANIVVVLPAPASVSYFAMFRQTIYSAGGTYKLQWWNGSSYVDCFAAQSPTDDKPIMKTFASVTASQFRIVITATPKASIGLMSFGPYMEMEHGLRNGFAPPRFARNTEVYGTMSESGVPLGRAILRKGFKTTLNFEFISQTFARNEFDAFLQHIEEKPFFMLWDYDNYPNEAAFCELDGGTPSVPYTHHKHGSCSVPISGLIE